MGKFEITLNWETTRLIKEAIEWSASIFSCFPLGDLPLPSRRLNIVFGDGRLPLCSRSYDFLTASPHFPPIVWNGSIDIEVSISTSILFWFDIDIGIDDTFEAGIDIEYRRYFLKVSITSQCLPARGSWNVKTTLETASSRDTCLED